MPRQILTEAAPTVQATAVEGQPGRMLIQLISPGWGSSGFYSEAVLKQAATDRVWPAGTQMMINHQTYSEAEQRPEGSLHDLASVLAEDARWDDAAQALVAEARVFSAYRTMLTEMADDIGTSIRASAEISHGEAEGRHGVIVDRLMEGNTVDFVTKAGRGGKILAVLESARIGEATTADRQDQIARALPPRCWLMDHDPDQSLAYFATYDSATDRRATWQQAYEVAADDQSVTLTGTPVEVRVVTTFVPVGQIGTTETTRAKNVPTDPAGHTTDSSKEMNMPQIEEARLRHLEEAEGRVSTLEGERDTERTRAETAERALTEHQVRVTAVERARSATADLHPAMAGRVVERVTATVPTTDAGVLDETAFDAAVKTAIEAEQEYAKAFAPAGVTGFGASTATESTIRKGPRVNAWGRTITEEH